MVKKKFAINSFTNEHTVASHTEHVSVKCGSEFLGEKNHAGFIICESEAEARN